MTDKTNEEILNGVLPDPRSPMDVQKDYLHDELIPMAVVLNWNRDMSGAPKYSVRDQDSSSSCVGQGTAKALEIITGVVQSAHPQYRRRANYPYPGAYLQDAMDIIKNQGTTTEALDASQQMSETLMNRDVTVETPLTEPVYIRISPVSIDDIAMAIETQKHCVLTIVSSMPEWNVVKPIVSVTAPTFGHCICGIYYFTDEVENKCILVDESWGENQIRQRILTEDFIKARCTGAMYFVAAQPLPVPVKPKFTFSRTLVYGNSNYSVRALQDILKYEGFFPLNVSSTGYYGIITAKGVLAWQLKHSVDTIANLNALQGRSFGPKSIKVANALYSN